MRRTKEETAETKERILKSAAAEFRQRGFENVSVNDVMSAAGLTHGGFYRHFESKDQLISEACDMALVLLNEGLEKHLRKNPGQSKLKALLERYLSVSHRDNPAAGCTIAALGSELARADLQARKAATHGYRGLVNLIAGTLPGPQKEAKKQASAIASALVGAVTLSRIVDDRRVADEILDNTLRFLLDQRERQKSK
ncbi:MAG TPA: TetR/AcrR family transcriptional regulator [Chroococcales cyanobacterium]